MTGVKKERNWRIGELIAITVLGFLLQISCPKSYYEFAKKTANANPEHWQYNEYQAKPYAILGPDYSSAKNKAELQSVLKNKPGKVLELISRDGKKIDEQVARMLGNEPNNGDEPIKLSDLSAKIAGLLSDPAGNFDDTNLKALAKKVDILNRLQAVWSARTGEGLTSWTEAVIQRLSNVKNYPLHPNFSAKKDLMIILSPNELGDLFTAGLYYETRHGFVNDGSNPLSFKTPQRAKNDARLLFGLMALSFIFMSRVVAFLFPSAYQSILPTLMALSSSGANALLFYSDPLNAVPRTTAFCEVIAYSAIVFAVILWICSWRKIKFPSETTDWKNRWYLFWFFGGIALGLAFLLIFAGQGRGGRGIFIPFLGTCQPTSIIYLFSILSIVMYLGGWGDWIKTTFRDYRFLWPFLGFLIVLFIAQKDLGSFLVLLFTALFLYAITITKNFWKYTCLGLGIAVLTIVLANSFSFNKAEGLWRFTRPVNNMIERANMRNDPWGTENIIVPNNPHLAQSLWTFSSGGFAGAGIDSAPTRFNLPDGHTDFVLAGVGEVYGWRGVITVLVLFGWLIHVLLKAALLKRDFSDSKYLLLAGGAFIFIQTMLISCGVLGVLPLTGVPLLFVAAGGVATVAGFMLIALCMVATSAPDLEVNLKSSGSYENPRDYVNLTRYNQIRWVSILLPFLLIIPATKAFKVMVGSANKTFTRNFLKKIEDNSGNRQLEFLSNPRIKQIQQSIRRGTISDSEGIPLATDDPDGIPLRGDMTDKEKNLGKFESFRSFDKGLDLPKIQVDAKGRIFPLGATTRQILMNMEQKPTRAPIRVLDDIQRADRGQIAIITEEMLALHENTDGRKAYWLMEAGEISNKDGTRIKRKPIEVKDGKKGETYAVMLEPDFEGLVPAFRGRGKYTQTKSGALADLLADNRDVLITVDAYLQLAAKEAIESAFMKTKTTSGAAYAIDIATGNVLASVSLPSYSNNSYSDPKEAVNKLAILLMDCIDREYIVQGALLLAGVTEIKEKTPEDKLPTTDAEIIDMLNETEVFNSAKAIKNENAIAGIIKSTNALFSRKEINDRAIKRQILTIDNNRSNFAEAILQSMPARETSKLRGLNAGQGKIILDLIKKVIDEVHVSIRGNKKIDTVFDRINERRLIALLEQTIEQDAKKDRAGFEIYSPGSTFKMVTAAAALKAAKKDKNIEKKIIEFCKTFVCDGTWEIPKYNKKLDCNNKHPHGKMGGGNTKTLKDVEAMISEAMKLSCNVFFARLAHEVLGEQVLFDVASKESKSNSFRLNINKIEEISNHAEPKLPFAAIGQQVAFSPKEMAWVVAAIANGGKGSVSATDKKQMKPLLIPRFGNDTVFGDVIEPEITKIIRDAIGKVVNEPGGTAYYPSGKFSSDSPLRGIADGLAIWGKTGTAQVVNEKDRAWFVVNKNNHSWFVGFADIDNRYRKVNSKADYEKNKKIYEDKLRAKKSGSGVAFAFLVENAGYGGEAAVHAATKFLEKYKSRYSATHGVAESNKQSEKKVTNDRRL
ncbi:MAG: FtsW/RodA/SpoVE family cell cycle protein [Holophagaceae bacterium]|nr:FtsW/RodA/SpoVE family cell cycle protein [Holophagaceae bacterium]